MVKKYQLKNGMKVLLVESKKSPVVSVQVWVKTGSADEPKGIEGISHFIEHLVFKGSDKFGVGEIAAKIEGEGGELNAYTSFDRTVYYVTISKQFTETALDAVSQMMGFPTFDPNEINNERGVVIEEIKRGEDNPGRQASRALFETIYKKHPYGKPVIGYEKIIEKVKPETIVDYFHSRYVPSNMTLVVVGDFDSQEMRPLVKEYFGPFVDRPLKKAKRIKEPAQEKPRISVKKAPFEETMVHIAWRTPKANHKDVPALDLLSMVLGHGDSSRLMKALRIENAIANYGVSSTYTAKDPGFFAVSSSLNFENLELGLEEIKKQILKICREPITQEELNRVKTILASSEYYSLETVDGIASKYGAYEDLFDDYRYYKEFLKTVNDLTPLDIRKVARKYLKSQQMSVVLLSSKEEEVAKKIIRKWVSGYKKEFEGNKVEKSETTKSKAVKLRFPKAVGEKGLFKKVRLDSGSSVIVKPNFDTAVVSLKSAFLGGLRVQAKDAVGVNELLSRVWASETRSYKEQELYDKLEGMATNLKAFTGRNSAGVSFSTLTSFSEEALEIYSEVLNHPALTDKLIEREKTYMKEYIKNRSDNPAQLCILQFLTKMFPEHPYGMDPYGTEEEIDQLNRTQVLRHFENMRSRGNFTLALVGNFEVEKWCDRLQQITKDMPNSKNSQPSFELSEIGQPIREFRFFDKKQTHIVLGYRGLTFTAKEKFDLQIIQAILAGQGGRLFLELRDKESLAYSVSPLRMDGIDTGYFGAYIACSPEKAKKSIQMMKTEFEKLMNDPVPEEEIARAKQYIVGSHDINLQKNSAQASSILFDDIYGVPFDEGFNYFKNVKHVNAKSIQELARKIFSQNEVISVVGSEKPF